MNNVKGKKYSYRVVEEDGFWRADIVRRKTSTENIVSKTQGGFASESEARGWGEKELQSFLQNLSERNKRHSEQRRKKTGKITGSQDIDKGRDS